MSWSRREVLTAESELMLTRQLLARPLRIGLAGRVAEALRLVPPRRLYARSLQVAVRYGVPFLASLARTVAARLNL